LSLGVRLERVTGTATVTATFTVRPLSLGAFYSQWEVYTELNKNELIEGAPCQKQKFDQ